MKNEVEGNDNKQDMNNNSIRSSSNGNGIIDINSNIQPKIEETAKPKKKTFDFIKKKTKPDANQQSNNSNSNTPSSTISTQPPILTTTTTITEINEQQLQLKEQDKESSISKTSSNSIGKEDNNNNNVTNSKSSIIIENENTITSNPIKDSTPLVKPQGKKGAFNFIKKSTISSSSSAAAKATSNPSITPSPKQNQSNESSSIPTPAKKQIDTKAISLILDSPLQNFTKESDHNNHIIKNQITEFKQLLLQLTQIRNEIQSETKSKTELQQSINQLTEKQNSLIDKNNFEDAIVVEEEIKSTKEKLKQHQNLIQLKTEFHLHNIKVQITNIFKAKTDQFQSYILTLSTIHSESTEAISLLNSTDKPSIEELSKAIESKAKDTDELNLEYQESLHQIERTESTYDKLFQEETKELTETITGLNTQSDTLQAEIEELRRVLNEKELLLQSINNQINGLTDEKKAIKSKYTTEESYVKLIKTKDNKLNTYNESLRGLNDLKSKHQSLNNHYDTKLKEISSVIESIVNVQTNDLPKTKHSSEVIDIMKTITQEVHDKRNQIHINEQSIEDYLIKINENNEKIEVLDLQNKRISNDIVSLDTNIKNLDEVKKAHVTRKQFKDAQAVTLEIGKYNEKQSSLENLLNENDKEINKFKGENEAHINNVEELKTLIKNINDEIKDNEEKFNRHYMHLLEEIEEELIKVEDKDSVLIRNEIEVIRRDYIEDEGKEQMMNKDKDNNNNVEEIVVEETVSKEQNEHADADDDMEKQSNDERATEEMNKLTENELNEVNDGNEKENETDANTNTNKEPELSKEELTIMISELETKLTQAIEKDDFEEADNLNQKIEEYKNKLNSKPVD